MIGIGRKRFCHVTRDRLEAWEADGGALRPAGSFAADAAGREAFARMLAAAPPARTYLLVDVVEEDFHPDTLPHVNPHERSAVVRRRQEQFHRATPYHHWLHQGRETTGQRQDRVLFTALNNPELIRPWTEILDRGRTPLAGIYSPALLARRLVRRLAPDRDNLLLLTLQQPGQMRQTFFLDGELRFSRLVEYEPENIAMALELETTKTRAYLNTQRLLPRDAAMNVLLLSGGELMARIATHCQDSDQIRHHYLDFATAVRRLGLHCRIDGPYTGPLLLHLLWARAPANQYAPWSERHYHRLWQSRIGLYGASLVIALGGTGLAGAAWLDGLRLQADTRAAIIERQTLMTREMRLRHDLPREIAEVEQIRAAVDLADAVARQPSTPQAFWSLLGAALQAQPEIRLSEIDWRNTDDPDPRPGTEPAPGTLQAASPDTVPPTAGQALREVAFVSGRFAPFNGDYRAAMVTLEALRARLAAAGLQVEVLQQPIDAGADSSLSGSTGSGGEGAAFTLRLMREAAS